MKAQSDVFTSPELRALKPILKEWIAVILDYCHAQQKFEDNPWWYNERATLSTLAAAAWRHGWVALEEFSTAKRARVPERKTEEGDVQKGRCDLFIGRRRGEEFAIEAKQAWQSIGRRSCGKGNVLKAAKLAWRDAACLEADEADTRLALTFIVPYVPPSEVETPGVQMLIDEWLAGQPFQTGRTAPCAHAYVFPAQGGGFVNDRGWAFPGVAVLAEWRRRRLKRHKAKA